MSFKTSDLFVFVSNADGEGWSFELRLSSNGAALEVLEVADVVANVTVFTGPPVLTSSFAAWELLPVGSINAVIDVGDGDLGGDF